MINNSQLFNTRQQEYYCATDKLPAFLFNTSVDSHESSTTFSCCNIISRQWWSSWIRFM